MKTISACDLIIFYNCLTVVNTLTLTDSSTAFTSYSSSDFFYVQWLHFYTPLKCLKWYFKPFQVSGPQTVSVPQTFKIFLPSADTFVFQFVCSKLHCFCHECINCIWMISALFGFNSISIMALQTWLAFKSMPQFQNVHLFGMEAASTYIFLRNCGIF